MASLTRSRSRIEPTMSWHSKPDRLLLKPQRRLSRTRTSARSWKCSAICRPMKPAPPVIKTRIGECKAAHQSSDRWIVKQRYRHEDPFSARPSGCFSGCGAPRRENRFGDKLHPQRCARPAGIVPPKAWPESESLELDLVRRAQKKDRQCMLGDVSQSLARASSTHPTQFGSECRNLGVRRKYSP